MNNSDLGGSLHSNSVTMRVSDTKISINKVSVSIFAWQDIVKYFDTSFYGESLFRLDFWNSNFDFLKMMLSIVIVARLKMESFRISPFSIILEGELNLNNISCPGSKNVSGLFEDDGSLWILSTIFLCLSKSLLSLSAHLLTEKVFHKPANLLLHESRIHTVLTTLWLLSIVWIDSAPALLLIPFFGELFIDFSFMVSISRHVFTNDCEDSFGALFRPVDLEHRVLMIFSCFTVSAVVEVFAY